MKAMNMTTPTTPYKLGDLRSGGRTTALSRTVSASDSNRPRTHRSSLSPHDNDMHHTLQDGGLDLLTSTQSADLDFEKMIKLFTDKHTHRLVTRQASAVRKILRGRKTGYLFEDFPYVQTIMQFLITAIARRGQKGVFMEPLCGLINLHSIPFRSQKAYAEIENIDQIKKTFRVISSALTCRQSSINIAIGSMLSKFVNTGDKSKDNLRYHVVATSGIIAALLSFVQESASVVNKSSKRLDIHRRSSRMSITGSAIIKGDESPAELHAQLLTTLIQTCHNLSFSADCSAQLGSGGYFAMVSAMLEKVSHDSPIVEMSMETIWNILELHPSSAGDFGSEANIKILSRLLKETLVKGYRAVDKELRNDILVVLSMVAKVEKCRPHFARSDCLRVILKYCTYSELHKDRGAGLSLTSSAAAAAAAAPATLAHTGTDAVRSFTQTADLQDYEMRMLMWTIVSTVVPDILCHSQIADSGFLKAILVYIDPESSSTHPHVLRYKFTQLIQLQALAVQVLRDVVPFLPEQQTGLEGNHHLVMFAKTIITNYERSEEKSLAMEQCITLQAKALSSLLHITGRVDFSQYECKLETMGTILSMFCDENLALTSRADAMSIIAGLCKSSKENKRVFRKANGLTVIIDFLNYSKINKNQFSDMELLFGVVQSIWDAVAGDKSNEAYFFINDGVDAVLNLLHECPFIMRKQLLGCLSDLFENPKAHKYVHEWQAPVDGNHRDPTTIQLTTATISLTVNKEMEITVDTKRTALQLFLSLWSEEEIRLNAGDGTATVHDVSCPLVPPSLPFSANTTSHSDHGSSGIGSRGMKRTQHASFPSELPREESGGDETSDEEDEESRFNILTGTRSLSEKAEMTKSSLFEDPKASMEAVTNWKKVEDVIARVDLRPTLYSVMKQIGFFSFSAYATSKQLAQMKLIENYVVFKQSQCFEEIKQELESESIVPVDQDAAFLEQAIDRGFATAETTATYQEGQLMLVSQNERGDMNSYLDAIKNRKNQKGIDFKHRDNIFAQMATMKHRLDAKEKREEMLRRSLDQHATLQKTTGFSSLENINLAFGGASILTDNNYIGNADNFSGSARSGDSSNSSRGKRSDDSSGNDGGFALERKLPLTVSNDTQSYVEKTVLGDPATDALFRSDIMR